MGTEEVPATTGKKPQAAPLPPPPALFLVRLQSRARSRVADLGGAAAWPGPPDTPPRRSPVTVPFLWEEAPGKPKAPQGDGGPGAVPSDVGTTTTPAAGDHNNGGARPAPLKLPPRLQRVASAKQRDGSFSPKTVLHGPYYGCAGGGGRRPSRRTASGSGFSALRRTPSAGVGPFSWSRTSAAGINKNKAGGGRQDNLSAAAPDTPWSSPAASSASSTTSSSSLSTGFFGDDNRRPADGREDGSEEEDECARGAVRITRFRRNQSLPSLTTSHLWASIRRSVKHITPWS